VPPRPDAIRVALLNLMPDKIRTETQFARCLGGWERPVELIPAKLRTYRVRHAQGHVDRFYTDIHDVLSDGVDALIVTGAPVETMPFESVAYWSELSTLLRRARHAAPHRLYVCWAAQAALHAAYAIPKIQLPAKAFGVFDQRVLRPDLPLMEGIGMQFPVPVSRHTTTRESDLAAAGVTLLAGSRTTGPGLAESRDGREVYSFNHFEYDPSVLWDEYRRDLLNGVSIARPKSYFRDGDPAHGPDFRWGEAAQRFFSNWLKRVESTKDAAGASSMSRPHLASCNAMAACGSGQRDLFDACCHASPS
jgi:homoserine O-succinyltransferase